MRLDLSSLALSSAGRDLGLPAHAWLRASLDIEGIEHFVDLVSARVDRHGIQRGGSKELTAMLRFHHLAAGADGPFACISYCGHSYVLFVTPHAL